MLVAYAGLIGVAGVEFSKTPTGFFVGRKKNCTYKSRVLRWFERIEWE